MAVTARFAADFSDFASAVQKADIQLKGFEDGAGKVQTSLTRMANSLSGTKLVSDATLMAEAVERVGGVSKLTEKELERVSAQAKEAAAKLVAMGQDVPPGIQKIADAGAKTSGVFGDLATQVKATALGFVSAQAIIGVVQGSFRMLVGLVDDSIKSYASAEAATKKMTAALQAQGTATPAVIAQFNDLATTFQRTTVYSDDLINEMQALLTSVGDVAPREMDKALEAATNLASGLGIDLRAATMMVSKASEENVGALKKSGVQLDETRVAAEGMSYILDVVNEKFGGAAQAEMETYAGKIQQIANAWDNVQEVVGGAIVTHPLLVAALRSIKEGADEAGTGASTLGKAWGDTVALLPQWAQTLGSFATTIADVNNTLAEAAANLPKAPKSFAPQGDPFADMMARAKQFGDELVVTWGKGQKASDAYATSVAAMFAKFSGSAATGEMGKLDAVFKQLAASGQLTEKQIDAIVKEALKLQSEGGKLTPRLWEMVLATDALSVGLETGAFNFNKLGTQVDIVIPKAFQFGVAVQKGIGDWANLSKNVSKPEVPDAIKKATDSVGDLAKSFAQLSQIAGGSLGTVLQSMGTLVASLDTANKGVKSFKEGLAGFKAGDLLSGIANMSTGIMGMASAAIAAGKAIAGLFDRNKGRDLVKDFIKDNFGDASELQRQLLELGPQYDKLWRGITQLGDNSSTNEAQAAIDAVTAALAKHKAAVEENTVSTEAEAQATIETAAAAAKALDEVSARLAVNRDEWGAWSLDVTGYLQKLADDIRAMPLPTPSGPSGGTSTGGGSGLYRGTPGRAGGGEGAVHVYIGNAAVDQHVLRVVRTKTPGDLMVRGR